MEQRILGDTPVGAIGLGGMWLSLEGRPDRARAIATISAALDAGITLIDTADAYSANDEDFGHNEELIAEALRTWAGDTSTVVVATKGGHLRTRDGAWTLDGSRGYLRSAVEDSLRRLGVDRIDLYQHHRPDPEVPYEESISVLAELLDEGKIRYAGISNANPDQIRQAREILGGRLTSVQNQFSPAFRSSEPELRLCDELGIAFLPWGPLGGIGKGGDGPASRFGAFQEVAGAHGVSPQQVCLAWLLAKSSVVIPIPGSTRPETIRDSARAAELKLSDDELARLDAA